MVEVVGELLAAAPSITLPLEGTIIVDKLAVYLDPLLKNGRLRRNRSSPLTREMLRNLRTGQTTPQLDTLLTLCWWLNTSPLRFLLDDVDPASIEYRVVQPKQECDDDATVRRGAVELDYIRVKLEDILADPTEPPPSLSAVARRLDCHYTFLLKRFPEQSSLIAARFRTYRATKSRQRREAVRQEIQRTIHTLHATGIYPSLTAVAQHMSRPRSLQHPEALVVCH